MEELETELEVLRDENATLLGLMAGGYAYFLRRFIIGHQNQNGLTPEECEDTIMDALRRVMSTQERFGYEYLEEIESVLEKMTTVSLKPYLQKSIKGE
jgi:hypothetical protein